MNHHLRKSLTALRRKVVGGLVDLVYYPIRQRMEEEERLKPPRRPKVGDFVYVLKVVKDDIGFRRTLHLALVTRVRDFYAKRIDVVVLAPPPGGEMLNVPPKGVDVDERIIEPAVWVHLDEEVP